MLLRGEHSSAGTFSRNQAAFLRGTDPRNLSVTYRPPRYRSSVAESGIPLLLGMNFSCAVEPRLVRLLLRGNRERSRESFRELGGCPRAHPGPT